MKFQEAIHLDLLVAQKLVYEQIGLLFKNVLLEKEGKEYSACTFELNNNKVHFRMTKITPKKIGQFVTFWKRIGAGPIMPYDVSDPFDFLIVSVRFHEKLGQFIFNKSVLFEQGYYQKMVKVKNAQCDSTLHGILLIIDRQKKHKLAVDVFCCNSTYSRNQSGKKIIQFIPHHR